MKAIIDYFDRAYVINLKHRTDRRWQVTREFRRLGVDVPSDKVLFYDAIRPTEAAGFPSIGVRGCFLSHKNILDLAYRDGLSNVLILEDDVSFRYASSGLISSVMTSLIRDEWDLVFLGYGGPDDLTRTQVSRWQADVSGTHFYGVNGKFIGTMLQYMKDCELRPRDHQLGGPMPADGVYNHVRYVIPDVKLLLPPRSLALQRSSRTDIAPSALLDRIPHFSVAVRSLRAVKHTLRMKLDALKLKAADQKASGTSFTAPVPKRH